MNMPIGSLIKSGFVYLPYPPELRKVVERAVHAWKGFCALGENVKTNFPYFDVNGVGVGYELKKVPGLTLDLKEDFHFSRGASSALDDEAATFKSQSLDDFIKSANALESTMKSLVVDFAEKMEKEFTLHGFAREIEESEDIWVIRFLHYFGGSNIGDEIAKAHADKSGFTLHLYESDPGLQYLNRSYEWRELPVSKGETVIIPGMRGQYRSRGDLKATFHRVVATPETAVNGRFSIVAFIHPKHTPAYNKEGAGRLQEFKPGFNYEMPFGEFSRLFVR